MKQNTNAMCFCRQCVLHREPHVPKYKNLVVLCSFNCISTNSHTLCFCFVLCYICMTGGHAWHILSESMLYRNDQVVILYSLILNDILKFLFINFYRSHYLRTPVTKQEQQELLTQALRRSFSTRETRRHYTAFKHREFFQFRRSRKSDM